MIGLLQYHLRVCKEISRTGSFRIEGNGHILVVCNLLRNAKDARIDKQNIQVSSLQQQMEQVKFTHDKGL